MRKATTKYAVALMIFMMQVGVASAALVIDYTGDITDAGKPGSQVAFSDQKLLLDNSIEWARVTGSCEPLRLSGNSNGLGFANALRMFLPKGWRVYADDDLELDALTLSWRDGDLWTQAIARAAAEQKFRALIDCEEKIINFKNAPELGSFAALDDVEESFGGEISTSVTSLGVAAASPKAQQGAMAPYKNESVQSYFQRYSEMAGFSRVAFKLMDRSANAVLRRPFASSGGSPFDFQTSMRQKGLIAVSGRDATTNASVLVVTDDKAFAGRKDVLVFPVLAGMMSDNSVRLASIFGWKVGENNEWPLDVDFRIPFGYDVVMIEPIDAFDALFAKYPVQAQLVIGPNIVNVVHRNSANRK